MLIAVTLKREISRYREQIRLHVTSGGVPTVGLTENCQETVLRYVLSEFGLAGQSVNEAVNRFMVIIERLRCCHMTLSIWVLPRAVAKDTDVAEIVFDAGGLFFAIPPSDFSCGLSGE